jgi:hypothetical protein
MENGVGSVIDNHGHCDLRHNRPARIDIKSEDGNFPDLITAQSPHYVDYFTWIGIVAWEILALAR